MEIISNQPILGMVFNKRHENVKNEESKSGNFKHRKSLKETENDTKVEKVLLKIGQCINERNHIP